MAFKEFSLDERTVITIYKKKTNHSLRLSIGSNGTIRVSIPTWAPYSAGVAFARSRQAWIAAQQRPTSVLVQGQPIGKAHHLSFVADSSITRPVGRLRTAEAVVTYPTSLQFDHPNVQKAAHAVSVRALRSQAESLLPQRLATLAAKDSFSYNSVAVKQLKSRWGSCDAQQNIVLNLFLMQLPWDCIDYVLLHELTHTKILQHGPRFWAAMENVSPKVKQLRKMMREYQPAV